MVRNVHMCTSQGSSLISINVRLAARVIVVKPEFRRRCAQIFPTFTGTSGAK